MLDPKKGNLTQEKLVPNKLDPLYSVPKKLYNRNLTPKNGPDGELSKTILVHGKLIQDISEPKKGILTQQILLHFYLRQECHNVCLCVWHKLVFHLSLSGVRYV